MGPKLTFEQTKRVLMFNQKTSIIDTYIYIYINSLYALSTNQGNQKMTDIKYHHNVT